MSDASSSHQSEAQARLHQQEQQIELKFAKIKALRREAHAVRRDAEQKRRNKETDQQILLLMQTDERLALLLSEAADSLRSLLPARANEEVESSHGAKAFEVKAQQWFSILNEVQYSLRTAVRYLRDSQLAPLTAPCGPEARQSGLAGSAGQGHSISLLEAFVDMSSTDENAVRTPSSTSPLITLPESQLSLPALRERDRNWKELSRSLEEIVETYSNKGSQARDDSTLNGLANGSGSDRLLLEALFNITGLQQ